MRRPLFAWVWLNDEQLLWAWVAGPVVAAVFIAALLARLGVI